MVLMTWNLGRRTHPDQTRIIANVNPDVVALQEVSPTRCASLTQALAHDGLTHTHAGRAVGLNHPFFMLLASRWPITPREPHGIDVPRPDRIQVITVHAPHGDLDLIHVHVPAATSSGVATKVGTFDRLARYLAQRTATPRILCGDFNTPKHEQGGHIEYWGDARQQRAERNVIEGTATSGLRDAYRALHRSNEAASWRASKRVTRRYDHVFTSTHLQPTHATYGDLDAIATAGISDHAPLTVTLTRGTGEARWAASDGPRVVPHDVPKVAPHDEGHVAPTDEQHVVPPDAAHGTPPGAKHVTPASPPSPISEQPARTTPPTRQPKESTMRHPTDEASARAFLESLTYRRDERNPPDDARRAQFTIQWQRGARGEPMSEQTLRTRLTWANLGYRAGKAFGPASNTTISAAFDQFAAVYERREG